MTAGPLPPNSRAASITDFRNGPSMRAPTALLLALTVAAAAPAGAADLLEIYRAAQTADAVYAGARATWAAGQEKLPQGRSGLLPSVTLSANTQRNDRDLQFRDATVPGLHGVALQLATRCRCRSPSRSSAAQNVVVYEQAKSQVAQADAVFAPAAQDLILRVAQAYFDVLLAQNTVELAAAQIAAIGQQLEQAKRNFEVGTATITDTHDAQARYDLTVSGEIAAQNDLEVKKRALQPRSSGAPRRRCSRVGRRFTLVDPAAEQHGGVGERGARLQPADTSVSQAALEFATQEVERNRAAHLPTLDAFATYSDTGTGVGRRRAARAQTDQQDHRPPARGADLPGRPDHLARARGARQPGKGAPGPRERAAHRGLRHAPGLPRRDQRHRAGQGARRGAGFQPELARFHRARAGSRSENPGRRAERAAAALLRRGAIAPRPCTTTSCRC